MKASNRWRYLTGAELDRLIKAARKGRYGGAPEHDRR